MSMFTPLFNQIIDSSIWEEPPHVRCVFITMLIKKRPDNTVLGTPYNLSRWACLPEDVVMDALRVLSSPDTRRLEPQPHEGRRIKKLEDRDGWLLLNGKKYQDEIRAAKIRAAKADWARKHRAEVQKLPKKGKPLKGEDQDQRLARLGVSDDDRARIAEASLPKTADSDGVEAIDL